MYVLLVLLYGYAINFIRGISDIPSVIPIRRLRVASLVSGGASPRPRAPRAPRVCVILLHD